MNRVKDVMTTAIVTIPNSTELADVSHTYIQKHITSAPIVGPDGDLRGQLTELGLIKAFLIQYTKPGTRMIIADHEAQLLDKATTIQSDEPLDKAMISLLKAPTHRLLVLDENKKLCGVLSPKDVLKILYHDLQLSRGAEDLFDKARKIKSPTPSSEDLIALYQDFFEHSPYMMHSVNDSGVIVAANKRSHEVLGYKHGELVNRSIKDIYLPAHWEKASDGLRRIMHAGTTLTSISAMKHKNGSAIPVEIKSTGIFETTGAFKGTLSVIRTLDSDPTVTSLMELIGVFEERGAKM